VGSTPDTIAPGNPYNTYTHPGLPPGPIAAATWQVILAAAYPNPDGQTPYLYFLNDTCQGHVTHFAKTNDEFNRLKDEYLLQKSCP
jgi:UPF0755 protein